ncbi:(3,5-dihydroxycyclohex-3-enyl)acetyl-CoA dehydratase subunit B [Streptomyces sp. DI166]|uniref:enoyl-CoA-hydratase DpgB n=1 Tax=unclassified Streptomyces TaxID=2593676 RepID=UPI0007F33198|nr:MULTISPECIES: enoyl-CoA-hydratase DpgB [unclassified Streptomyces]SBT91342.1 (3,5-dihydroxycyclohex-3-enyl)acetyl-CoA dehydratase subunit B [Streptomyces sp. DI166]
MSARTTAATAGTDTSTSNPPLDVLELGVDAGRVLSPALVAELDAFCDRLEASAATGRAVGVLRLTGGAGEPGLLDEGVDVHLVSKWERVLRRMERLGAPTLALAGGECGGVALDALLAADYRIAAPDLVLRLHARPDGMWPGMAVFRLASHAGAARVRRAVLFGAPLTAAEALRLDLLDEVVEDARREESARAAVELLTAFPGPELAVRRRLLIDATSVSFEEALGSHLSACDRSLRRERERAQGSEWEVEV